MDHKRVYEEEELLSWCLVLVIQVTKVWLLQRRLWASTYT